ncbi:MAG TPA: hypothetical protein VH439_06095 [Gemmatimonadales bacterium]
MQWGFLVCTVKPGVHVGAGIDQQGHGRRTVGEMARPVRHHMQQRACHAAWILRTDPRGSQIRALGQEPPQHREITRPDRADHRNRNRILGTDGHHHAAFPSPIWRDFPLWQRGFATPVSMRLQRACPGRAPRR